MILCIGKTPEHYALAKKLTGEQNDEIALRIYEELLPFVIEKWLNHRNRPYNSLNITGEFQEQFTDQYADSVEVQNYFNDLLKAYKQLDNVDFTLVKKINDELFEKPANYTKMVKTFNLTDHALGSVEKRYNDFKLQLIDQIYSGKLSQEMAGKLGYINYKNQNKQSSVQQQIDINNISNKTEDFGVETSKNSEDFWSKIKNGWEKTHPNGLVAYRKYGDKAQTFLPETVNQGWIGNPFSTIVRGKQTVQQFYDWITTGNNFGNPRATEELRQAIIQKILSLPEGTPILYYTELNRPSHATVLGYLVNNKQLLQQQSAQQAPVPASYEGLITPNENTIFVFGSNPEGRHGAGSAKVAVEKFGAIYGQGEGLQGNAYALPTKDLRVKENRGLRSISSTQIIENIKRMYQVAAENPNKKFKVAYTNKLNEATLNGYTGAEMIKMFKDAGPIPSNVVFSKNWTDHWDEVEPSLTEQTSPSDVSFFDLNISQEEYEAAAKKKAAESHTAIEYNTEFAENPINIQLDDIKFKMSVQDKRAALDIIADSFYNIITGVLEVSDNKLKAYAKERGVTVASLRVKYEQKNKELLSSIEKENAFKNPNQAFIQKRQSEIIPLTELDVIKAFGVKNIVDVIRRQLSNNPKTKLISDNFDALLRQAASKINNIYGINILGNSELFDNDDENSDNVDDPTNTEHNAEGSKEDFTHADDKTKASERSLTKELKLAYRQCYVTNDRGQIVTNSYGQKVPVDHSAAHNKVLHLLEGMIDVNDVIPMLQKSTEGWVKQFVNKLQYNPALLAQLYYCCKLSAQDYRIVYLKDGKLVQKSLNRLEQEELLDNETTSNITNGLLQTSKKLSVYDTTGKVNKEGIEAIKQILEQRDSNRRLVGGLVFDVLKANDIDNISDLDTRLRQVFKSLGITIPSTYNIYESIALYNTENPKKGLQALLNNIVDLLNNISKKEIIDTKDNYYVNIFKFIGKSDVGYVESSVTENGKSYYTYAKTNYIDELLLHLKQSVKDKKLSNGQDYYQSWQQEQFGKTSFFRNPKTQEWYSDWMSKLFGQGQGFDKYRKLISRCNVLYTNRLGNTKTEFTRWNAIDSMVTNYTMYKEAQPRLSDIGNLSDNESVAWYRMPIASDSNASDYLQFIKYVNTEKRTYDEILGDVFWNICKQELVRINDVTEHLNQKITGENTSADIKGYDAKQENGIITDAGGMIFTLLPQLNYVKVNVAEHDIFKKIQSQYLNSYNGASFLDVLHGLMSSRNNKEVVTEPISSNELKQFFLDVFYNTTERDFNNEFEEVKDFIGGESERANYREYYYNYMNAWIQMVELTSTDTAFFGKRKVKEVSNAKDADFTHTRYVEENGIKKAITHRYKIVSDDTLFTFQKRNKEYHAPTNKIAIKKPYFKEVYVKDIEILSEIRQNAVNTIQNNPNLSSKTKAMLLKKWNEAVNVADGQSYRSLQSYYELLEAKGVFSEANHGEEIKAAFNRVIYQHTWDEGDLNIIALAIKPYMYGVIPNNRSTIDQNGNPNIVMTPTQHKNSELPLAAALGAISASLDKSTTLKALDMFMLKHNIDVIHFNSVVKVGETGTVKVDYESTNVNDVISKLEAACGFNDSVNGNPEIVHNIPTAFWGEQLSKPEHLLDAKQLVGSQIRRLILSDLPTDPNYRIYINGKSYTTEEFKAHYQELITASLLEDFSSVDEIFKDPHQLEAFLQESIAGSTKYDEDLIEMFTWDDEKKHFKIPFWNRTVSNRVEELLLALVKNRIGKQKIAGGAAVQTAAVGLSKELNVRYQKNGKLLDTYNDWLQKNPNGTLDQYDEYIDGATLAYMEVYLPMWSKDMVEMLTDEKGVLHYERLPEELKYMVGYRIPTEDHYSCAPLYVKGFLPNLNASTIVVPADISLIAGSDYDIDVMYLMRHEFRINKYNEEALREDYEKSKEKFDTKHADTTVDKLLATIFDVDENTLTPKFIDYQRWRNQHIWDIDKQTGNRKYLLPKDQWTIEKIKYDTSKSAKENNRKARNNEFIDTIIGCLQSPHSLEKFTNVGNYVELKTASRILEILQHPSNTFTLSNLLSKTPEQLDEIVAELNKNKNLASPQTQTELHQQNMAGNQLKGIFVAAKSLQEIIQHAPLEVIHKFTINYNNSVDKDFTIGKQQASDKTLITKRFASYVAAAVDNGKDPLMNALAINPSNANIVNYLTLLGYQPLEIGLFLNCANINLTDANLTQERIKEIKERYSGIKDYSALKLDMMAFAVQNQNNLADERVIAMALLAQEVYSTVDYQSQLLMTLAKGLRADSVNLRKSIPENLPLMFAIDDFEQANTTYNPKTKQMEYAVFKPKFDKLPIHSPRILGEDNENLSIKDYIKLSIKQAELPYLQAFTDTVFTSSFYWMEPYTLYTKDRILEVCKTLNRIAGNQAPKVIGDFIDAYQRMATLDMLDFLVSDTNPEFNNLRTRREYLVKDFPNEFAKFKQHLPEELKDNLFIDNIIQVAPNNYDRFFHLEVKELGKNKDIRAKFKADCDRLNAYNPIMARKLFAYTTFRNGFGYSQKGWAHLTSINFQETIPGYIEALEGMKNINDKTFVNNLFLQFLTNNVEKYKFLFKPLKVDPNTQMDFNGTTESLGKIVLANIDNVKAVSFDGGESYIPITETLGANNFYHEYFKKDNLYRSVFDNSDMSVETEPLEQPDGFDDYYDINESVPSTQTTDDDIDKKEINSRQEVPNVSKKEQKGADNVPQC